MRDANGPSVKGGVMVGEGSVPAALEELEKLAAQVLDRQQSLRNRVEPVLLPNVVAEKMEPEADYAACKVILQIRAIRSILNDIYHIQGDLFERLQT